MYHLRASAGDEAIPILLPPRSDQEFRDAVAANVDAMQGPTSEPGTKRKRQAEPSAPCGSKDVPGSTKLISEASTGVQELCQVKRQSKCMFCEGSLKKGEWKFTFAARRNAPVRSIHTDCLDAMDRAAAGNSLRAVQSWLSDPGISRAQRLVCTQAVAKLHDVLQTEASAGSAC